MTKLEELVRLLMAIVKAMKDSGSNFDKQETTVTRNENYYSIKLRQFEDYWKQFSHNHFQICQLDKADVSDYMSSDIYSTTEKLYFQYIIKTNNALKKFEKTADTQPEEQPKPEVRLPQITIPKFDGNYRTWSSFRDLFTSIIHNDVSLSSVQKLHYLKTNVSGEAERLLSQFEGTSENYNLAWEFLEKRYNNKRVLVNEQLKLIFDFPNIRRESAALIKGLSDQIIETLHELKVLNVPTKGWDAMLLYILVQKLPLETQRLWEQEQGSETNLPMFSDFTAFLEARFRTLESLERLNKTNLSNYQPRSNKKTYSLLNVYPSCINCKGNHRLYSCSKFRQLSAEQRRKVVASNRLCQNCLSNNHSTAKCISKNTCKTCGKRHHTLLHSPFSPQSNKNRSKSSRNTTPKSNVHTSNINHATAPPVNNFFTPHIKRALLATALIRARDKFGLIHTLRAIIDSGSHVSFVTKSTLQRLGIKSSPADIRVSGLERTHTAYVRHKAQIQIESCTAPYKTKVEALVVKEITDFIPHKPIFLPDLQHIEGLELADPTFNKPGPIDLLLGADVYSKIIENGVRKSDIDGLPTAQNTLLGWILMGSIEHSKRPVKNFAIQVESESDLLNSKNKRFWEQKKVNVIPKGRENDELCDKIYQITHKRLKNGQYEVRLPFKEEGGPTLGQSRHIAIKQSLKLGNKFKKQPEYHKKCIQGYLNIGHMTEVTPPAFTQKANHYHSPHQAVIKNSSTNTKLRVVFNASAKSTNGRSLNQQHQETHHLTHSMDYT